MKPRLLIPAVCLALLMFGGTLAAAEGSPPPTTVSVEELNRRIAELEAEIVRLKALEVKHQLFQDEAQRHREFLERERQEGQKLLETLVKWGTGFAVLLTAAVGFMGWRTWAEGQQQIRSNAERIKKESEQALTQIQADAVQQMKQLSRQSVNYVQQRVDTLNSLLQREIAYRQARVLAIGHQEDLDNMKPELVLLTEKGISVRTAPHPVANVTERIQQGDAEIILYRYRQEGADKQDAAFRATLSAVADTGKRIPVLIYAPSLQVVGRDSEAMREYKWGTFAQSAATLVSHLYALTHLFQGGNASDTTSVS